MADPISIISLVEGSITLIVQCGSAIKSLNEIATKYKQAELILSSMIQEVDVIELAWKRIKDWFESYTNEAEDGELLERLDKSLKCGTNVISALQDDLLDYGEDRLGIVPRARLAWNENTLRDHQYRIRGQVQAMSLLLQVITLPNSNARSEHLQTAQNTLRKSDESAYSIVPSQMSIGSSDRDSVFSVESADFIQHRWSFEGDLFGARVYKRNYAKNLNNLFLHSKMAQANDDAFTIIANDAVSTSTGGGLEASANDILGSAGDDAPRTNVEPNLVLLSGEMSKSRARNDKYSWLDIVAIPGLIEEQLQTWTHPETRHLWLRDSLPTDFTSARIFTFNYPSYLLLTDDTVSIKVCAEKLLSDLKAVGAGYGKRRLVFIAHSYGGHLCKQACVLAKNDLRYLAIVRNTYLCCFFGFPGYSHEYLFSPFDLGDLVDLYLNGLGARTFSERTRSNLLETLKTNTGSLNEIARAFDGIVLRECILNFYRRDNAMSFKRKVSGTKNTIVIYGLTLHLI